MVWQRIEHVALVYLPAVRSEIGDRAANGRRVPVGSMDVDRGPRASEPLRHSGADGAATATHVDHDCRWRGRTEVISARTSVRVTRGQRFRHRMSSSAVDERRRALPGHEHARLDGEAHPTELRPAEYLFQRFTGNPAGDESFEVRRRARLLEQNRGLVFGEDTAGRA